MILLGLGILVEKARWLVQPRESLAPGAGIMLVLEVSSYAEEHHGEYDEGVDSKDQAWGKESHVPGASGRTGCPYATLFRLDEAHGAPVTGRTLDLLLAARWAI